MLVFLDANILFLAGYSRTSPVHDLIALAKAGHCQLVSSEYAIEEARRNLLLKGPADAIRQLEAALAIVFRVPEAAPACLLVAERVGLSDPADVPILAAALQCSAQLLVTGDRRAFGRLFRTTIAGTEVLLLRDALRRVLGLSLLNGG